MELKFKKVPGAAGSYEIISKLSGASMGYVSKTVDGKWMASDDMTDTCTHMMDTRKAAAEALYEEQLKVQAEDENWADDLTDVYLFDEEHDLEEIEPLTAEDLEELGDLITEDDEKEITILEMIHISESQGVKGEELAYAINWMRSQECSVLHSYLIMMRRHPELVVSQEEREVRGIAW